jgi:dUTP pyrophosphatase
MSELSNITFQQPVYQLNILLPEDPELFNYYSTFTSHYNGDSGIDLFNNLINVDSFKVGTLDFKIKCEMINLETNQFTSYWLLPRSSLSNTPFQMANSVGLIDAGYRGEIKAKIRNFNQNSENLPEGKFFQIVSPDLKPIQVKIVKELSTTARNDGGFGSTNKN